MFLLQSDEKQEAYFEMFDATQEYFDQFHPDYKLGYFTSDGQYKYTMLYAKSMTWRQPLTKMTCGTWKKHQIALEHWRSELR